MTNAASENGQGSSDVLLYSLSRIARERGDLWSVTVLANAEVEIENEHYDNWNGGLYRVHIRLRVDATLYAKLSPEERERICAFIRTDGEPILHLSDNDSLGKVVILPRALSVPEGWRKEGMAWLKNQGAGFIATDEGEGVRAPGGVPSPFRYDVGDRIGQGGFGTVHRASRSSSVAKFAHAIKFLDPSPFGGDPDRARERFKREVAAVQRLQHRGIVAYVDAGIDGQNRPYLVMPLIEGQDLRKAAEGRPHHRRPWLVAQVVEAVAYAHGLDVLHRDLKPSNILVRTSDDQPVIVDWGLAYFFEEASGESLTTSAVGSLGYIPSEVIADPKIRSPKHDVFACGVLLYELLAGRRPIPDDYRPLSQIASNLAVLDPIVRKAIAPASSRYATASALHSALRPVAAKLYRGQG